MPDTIGDIEVDAAEAVRSVMVRVKVRNLTRVKLFFRIGMLIALIGAKVGGFTLEIEGPK